MHEIFRSLLSCRTNRAVENALSLIKRAAECVPLYPALARVSFQCLHCELTHELAIALRDLRSTRIWLFFQDTHISVFSPFSKVCIRENAMSASYSREIFPFPLRPHENADNPALCVQKSLLQGPFSEICFFGTRNHRLRVDRRNGEKKSSFSKISRSHFNQVTETCESAKFVDRELYKF